MNIPISFPHGYNLQETRLLIPITIIIVTTVSHIGIRIPNPTSPLLPPKSSPTSTIITILLLPHIIILIPSPNLHRQKDPLENQPLLQNSHIKPFNPIKAPSIKPLKPNNPIKPNPILKPNHTRQNLNPKFLRNKRRVTHIHPRKRNLVVHIR